MLQAELLASPIDCSAPSRHSSRPLITCQSSATPVSPAGKRLQRPEYLVHFFHDVVGIATNE